MSGLLITGGYNGDPEAPYIAEVWLPVDQTFLLPGLPTPGWSSHTQSSLTACGGWETRTSCLTFDGEWEQSHSLSEEWYYHMSWQSPAGTLLMGGLSAGQSSELLSSTDNTTTPGFNLPYNT